MRDQTKVMHIRLTPEIKDALGRAAYESGQSMNMICFAAIARAVGFSPITMADTTHTEWRQVPGSRVKI